MKSFLFVFLLLLFGGAVNLAHAAEPPQWSQYKARFLAPEGRIVDTGNKNISHSEGQGYGMLLSVHYDDRPTFELLWAWSTKHLRVRGDALFSWKFDPKAAGDRVPDKNNATDGDLLIAWALLRAGAKWGAPEYREAARAILADVKRKLVWRSPMGPVLLPGEKGFFDGKKAVLNLSYWIFPAFDDFARVDDGAFWRSISKSGLSLLRASRFGRWRLPSDWVEYRPGQPLKPAASMNTEFGYNAIRIPLYLIWGRQGGSADITDIERFWDHSRKAAGSGPTVNLITNVIARYPAPIGMRSVYELVEFVQRSCAGAPPRPTRKARDYYSATLLLLSQLVAREAMESCPRFARLS